MTIARRGEELYVVERASSTRDLAAVFHLREEIYAEAQSYLLTDKDGHSSGEDAYDARSFVFTCRKDEEVVASCRFTEPQVGRWELSELAPAWPRPPVDADHLVETSRVVVRHEYRATGLVEAMLLLAGSYLLEETLYLYNFAVCVPPLVRFYERLGMRPVTREEIRLAGRPQDRSYVVIWGDMRAEQPAVTQRLSARGWDLSDVREAPVAKKSFGMGSHRWKAGT